MEKRRVPNGVGPEGKTYFITVNSPKLVPGAIPPEPKTPPADKDLMTKKEFEKFRAGQADGSQPLEQRAYTQSELIPSNKEPDDQTSG
jgi:hypothetical protein